MDFDFSKVSKTNVKPTDPDWSNPVSFFYKLSHPNIRDLYPVQRDILQNWYSEFKKGVNDKMVSLNTGGGKTLIGLMIAEAIRREANGKVLYICPNNYLGKQTLAESEKYGIKVSSYLNIGGNTDKGPQWREKEFFLENATVCITNYHAVFNSRSIFKDYVIRGIVFDDAHLSLDLLDDQYTLRIEDTDLIKKITNIFKSSQVLKEKVSSVQEGDPFALIMIPPLEWHRQAESIKSLLSSDEKIKESLQWFNLKEKIDKTFCFVSAKRMEISLLYPDIKTHYAFREDVHRVYLSATLPNLDDLTRVLGITPTRIETNSPDYRPQRLFVFSRKVKFENSDSIIRQNLTNISPKTFVLVPNKEYSEIYREFGASIAGSSSEVVQKIENFKSAENDILVLANRYDGIDLPGGTCHCLLIDGLPYTGTLKTRFFSEYFHNHRNSFLRSIVASKLVQAFGRTIRGNNDYSIIILLNEKLNSWVINLDNRKFFKLDLLEDIEIGSKISETITKIEELISLSREILSQTENWKKFLEVNKSNITPQEILSEEAEIKNISLAKRERIIYDYFLNGDYQNCLKEILTTDKELGENSKPILGLYLSIAAICSLEIKDNPTLCELSARAYGISPIFGMPVTGTKRRTLQAQRIIDFDKNLSVFDWELKDNFDENLRLLGEMLGFEGRRPESEGEGTLDVCWEDEEKKFIIGFENKINKTNKILSKQEIDQCSGHEHWLEQEYSYYKKILFVVGDFEGYNGLASPSSLYHLRIQEIEKVYKEILQIHAKKIYPNQIESSLDSQRLRIESVFPKNKVIKLTKR